MYILVKEVYMANEEKRLTEELEKLLELRKGIENEMDQFNKKMEAALGGDTRSMYFGPSHLFDDYLIKWIMRNLNEARYGAEWFLYEALGQMSKGGSTFVVENGKKYTLHNVAEYVSMCVKTHVKGKKK
jgi:hypothetical protein